VFVGHYGVSFAAKGVDARIPLWLLFLAVQAVDVLWAVLVLLGIEKVKLIPGITAANPLDLYYIPYTHSLVAALSWSALAFFASLRWRRPTSVKAAVVVAAAVFSHWALDLLVHRPDLPLYDDAHKVGLGLWNYPRLSFVAEVVAVAAGMLIYARARRRDAPPGRLGLTVVGGALVIGNAIFYFGPFPPSVGAVAVMVLASYAVFTAAAAWLESRISAGASRGR